MDTPRLWDFVPGDPRPPRRLTLQQRYRMWRATPDGILIVDAVTEAALRLRRRGFRHYGIAALFEAARYTYALKVGPDAEGFKINNNWRSRLARDLMVEYDELNGFFELRDLRTA